MEMKNEFGEVQWVNLKTAKVSRKNPTI